MVLCKTTFVLVFIFVAMLLVNSCVVEQKKPFVPVAPSAEKGSVVYVYRPNSFSNVVVSPDVLIDGSKTFPISNNKYTYVYLQPGTHTLKLDLDERYKGDKEHVLEVEPGEIYYLRIDTSMKFKTYENYARTFSINRVDAAIGLNEINETRYIKPKMPSKYLFDRVSESGESTPDKKESTFSIEKTTDPFGRN